MINAKLWPGTPTPMNTPGPISLINTNHTTPLPNSLSNQNTPPIPYAHLIPEFEASIIKSRLCAGEEGEQYRQHMVRWRKAQSMLVELNLSLNELSRDPVPLWNLGVKQGLSADYFKKIVRLLNLWGDFQAQKENKIWANLPIIPRVFAKKQKTAFLNTGRAKEALPLTEAKLKEARQFLRRPHYEFLQLSFYLGLRPGEVDNLKEGRYEILTIGKTQVLKIWQNKVSAFKFIPLVLPEQIGCLKIIEASKFKKPLARTLQKHLGKGYTTYAGRKGFADFLASRNVSIDEASLMLGHKNVGITERVYSNPAVQQVERLKVLLGRK